MGASNGGGRFGWRTRLVVLVTAMSVALHAAAAVAQSVSTRGSVTQAAPIYLLPDRGHQPLRTMAEGTLVDVLTREGDWIQVRFRDPEFGPRVGFIEARFIELLPASDAQSSEPSPSAIEGAPQSSAQRVASPVSPRPSSVPGLGRQGFWFNGGLGYGSVGCDSCVGLREGGLSGGVTFGATLSAHVLLGAGTSGFTRTDGNGGHVNVGTLDARVRIYPSSMSGVFLTGGYGLGRFSRYGDTQFGSAAAIGMGWDLRVGRNVSLTPFFNGVAMRSSLFDANVGQVGLGVTVH